MRFTQRIDVLVRLVDHDGVDWSDDRRRNARSRARRMPWSISAAARRSASRTGQPERQRFLPASSPIEFRHFKAEDEAEAWQWLGVQPRGA